jgi:sigma-B regulation protein RsbU (phosphoserine phosphatase)
MAEYRFSEISFQHGFKVDDEFISVLGSHIKLKSLLGNEGYRVYEAKMHSHEGELYLSANNSRVILVGSNDCVDELEKKISDKYECILLPENDQSVYHNMQVYMSEAQKMQKSLLPSGNPVLKGYSISSRMLPAYFIGGDMYDYIPIPQGTDRLGLMIGDVSDKGIHAAIYMAQARGVLRAGLSFPHKMTPAKVLMWMNLQLLQLSDSDAFITMIYGVLDAKENTFTYANAGHPHPLLFDRKGKPVPVPELSGPALGVFPDPVYTDVKMKLNRFDTLLTYTDGIIDETNPDDELYGLERLLESVSKILRLKKGDIANTVVSELAEFQGETPAFDDRTLSVVQRTIKLR